MHMTYRTRPVATGARGCERDVLLMLGTRVHSRTEVSRQTRMHAAQPHVNAAAS